jgi:hypothetical protein
MGDVGMFWMFVLVFENKYHNLASVLEELQENQDLVDLVLELIKNQQFYNFRNGVDNAINNLARELHPAFLEHFVPVCTSGGGDCFYNAISKLLFGNEDMTQTKISWVKPA